MSVVLGALPHYGNCHPRTAAAFWHKATKKYQWYPTTGGGSLLAHVFNVLWLQALVARPKVDATHWAMLHSDVIPEGGWVDILVDEMEAMGADVISAVLPIKDRRGVTSTAIDDPADEWTPLRRLTMREVHRLPETFTAADCGYPGHALLVNTGCMLVDLRKPWVDLFPGFEIKDKVRRVGATRTQYCDPCEGCGHIGDMLCMLCGGRGEVTTGGDLQAVCCPEDWNFSRWLHARGCKVLATRKVHADHCGDHRFPNDSMWGEETDPAYALKHGNRPVPPVAEDAPERVAVRNGSPAPVPAGTG